MKLAISNIAWLPAEDGPVADLMASHGVRGVEIAPTAVWQDPLSVSQTELADYRQRWEDRGLVIVALQALLFGRPELRIFGDATVQAQTLKHLQGMMRIGAALGARVLVFGSPKNRSARGLRPEVRDDLALRFFRAAGEFAQACGVVLCIEANPTEYGCDFITRSEEALELVRQVGSPGFGLHLDAGAMAISGEAISEAMARVAGSVSHFHASEPFLAPLGTAGTDHPTFASALRQQGYGDWVSLEMRRPAEGPVLQRISAALAHLARVYGN